MRLYLIDCLFLLDNLEHSLLGYNVCKTEVENLFQNTFGMFVSV